MGDATAVRWVTKEEWLSREGVWSELRGPRPVGCWRRGRRFGAPGAELGAPRRGRPPVRLDRCGSLPGRGRHKAPPRSPGEISGPEGAASDGGNSWKTRGSQAETKLVFSTYSVGERGAGSRGTHGERQAQEGPKATNDLLQLSAGCPAAPFPESPVSGLA